MSPREGRAARLQRLLAARLRDPGAERAYPVAEWQIVERAVPTGDRGAL